MKACTKPIAVGPLGIVLLILLVGCRLPPPRAGSVPAGVREAVMGVLDRYMDALNALDIEAHVATYQFPHFRLASGELAVWERPEQAMPLLALPAHARRARLRASLGEGWQRSEWVRRDIVQADATKVHVATRFVRLRADGSEIARFDSLYVLTLRDGSWGIRGRSSFAP